MTTILSQKISATTAELFEECREQPPIVRIEIPSDPKYGDYSTNVAMQLAPVVKDSPLRIATKLREALGEIPGIESVEVVPPGFMNFKVSTSWFFRQIAAITKDPKSFGTSDLGQGRRMLLEFISANPTGPMTLGNGRGGFAGDTLANIMSAAGFNVSREYYVNNIGNQVDRLAESVIRRSFQLQGINVEYPEDLYQGEYIADLAKQLQLQRYSLKSAPELKARIKGRVVNMMIKELERVVEKKMKITFDRWFKESELIERGLDEKVLAMLRERELLYEQDGAIWFKTTAYGDDKDRVLIKSDGEKTYFLSDIALRYDRFVERKFEHEILFLGADHHGYIGRLKAAVTGLGFPGAIDIFIVQFARLMKDGVEVKISKRAGNFVTIEELIDEVGADAARFFFLLHAANTHMDFDLNLAKDRSDKNPVYYVQYAHARICSILKKAHGLPEKKSSVEVDPSEVALMKEILRLPTLVEEISRSYDVHKLPFYAVGLATAFHSFYTRVRVIDDGHVDPKRLDLIEATKIALAKALGLMGVTAPSKM
ncbi:MAG: arginine--tRNA ligase [Candidatus Kerfeldbacteria bacterium]|nr:arginine--tRNA ligase [Candidatus Kerfeldbacteria bacterium]